MEGKGATSLAVAATSCPGEFFIAIMGAGGRAVIADTDNPRIFGEDCSYVFFDAMGSFGQVNGQLHKDIIKIWTGHRVRSQKLVDPGQK